MRVVIQRVRRAAVEWAETNADPAAPPNRREIGPGLAIMVAAGPTSTPADAHRLATKTANLRIFPDDQGRTNRSLLDIKGEALAISQFTLYADASRGRRPSYIQAGDPARARDLCEQFARALADLGINTHTGNFGAHMLVTIENDGPVTMVLSTDDWQPRV